jgi:ABC-type lipoprotein release transport system permease subunit
MKEVETYIVFPENKEQANALKAFVKALKMKFEITQKKEYNPEFVEEIERSLIQIEDGETTRIEDIDEFLGVD